MSGTEREGAEAGPVVEPDENQRADAGSEQPGREHHSEHRAADPGHLHHQEGGRKRRAEERADRCEAPGCADHGTGHLRRVALEQVNGEHSEAAADRDQRRLRAKDDAEAERGERGNDDPGELDRPYGSGCLKPLCRLVPSRSRQVLDCERHQQAAQRKQRNRPPGRLVLEAEVAGQRAEQILLQLGETLEKEVRGGRRRHSDDRAEREQHDVRAALQKLERTWRCLCRWRRLRVGVALMLHSWS